jgi:choline-sulfatase
MKKQPNILFLMSDEHRPDVVGYEGNEIIRTPILDELARTGVVFRNAYTPSPVCVPGRQAMIAGQFPRTCGCEWFGEDLDPGYMTFARRFAQYAYNTTACGRLHHMGVDQMQGWTERVCGDLHVHASHIAGRDAAAVARYPKPDDGTGKWSDVKEIKRAGIGGGARADFDRRAVEAAQDCVREYFVAADYDRPRSHQPLMLKLSFFQPHYPYVTDEEKFTYYLNRVQPFLNQQLFPHPWLSMRTVTPGTDVSVREIKRAMAAYYGMIETVDMYYGQILDTLRQVGQDLDDWIIVYTTDHGEMLGEHGIWEKKTFFEASARVPLIIRWPAGFDGGRMVHENVNLCDLFATLCDLCDIPTPEGLDSRSLVPLLHGKNAGWNNETLSQYGNHLMIKRDHLKYHYYGRQPEAVPADPGYRPCPYDPAKTEVLFDLEKDPDETQNFIDDPQYTDIIARFQERCASLGFGPDADPNYVNAGY